MLTGHTRLPNQIKMQLGLLPYDESNIISLLSLSEQPAIPCVASMGQCSPPVELTTYRTTIMRSGFSAPFGVNKRGVSSHHRREGVSAHPVYLNLCSPFLDIGAACPPPTLTAHHSIIATHVAPVCNGWNHRPAASLGCYQYVNERLLAEGERFELPNRCRLPR